MFFPICLETIYPSLKLSDRIKKVASHGFEYIDIWDWRNKDIHDLEHQLKANGVKLNAFSGHRDTSTSIAADRAGFLKELGASIAVARQLDCENLMIFSDGILPAIPGTEPPVTPSRPNVASAKEKLLNIQAAVQDAVDLVEKEGITLLLEALNDVDHPGYFLRDTTRTLRVIKKVASDNLKMLYDVYHIQKSEGNITATLLGNLPDVGYIHFAEVPGRHEPGTGELDAKFILDELARHKYRGGFGFEYSAAVEDDGALKTIRALTKDY